ncbi:hypothetical protein QL285_074793 [Trifolium repens]|nr:hypothetical protein QL285_074793 [Trifolium repens]
MVLEYNHLKPFHSKMVLTQKKSTRIFFSVEQQQSRRTFLFQPPLNTTPTCPYPPFTSPPLTTGTAAVSVRTLFPIVPCSGLEFFCSCSTAAPCSDSHLRSTVFSRI